MSTTTQGDAAQTPVALHPGTQRTFTMHVAPTHEAERNTLRAALMPFACWRVDDVRFEFDSSFVLPDIADELAALAKIIDENTKAGVRPPASVFGHADPVGDDAYNKKLSGRRARAIYALLARDTAAWEQLYAQPHGGDDWAARGAVATMLVTLEYGSSVAEKKRFQGDHGLAVDGDIGPVSRAVLFKLYMDALAPIQLERGDFLGRGADPGGKGDYQGCGEFNPAMVFSGEEFAEYSKPQNHAKRNLENGANRRVLVFLFRPGTKIDVGRWPCPRASEGSGGCRARFWSDGEARLVPGPARREFKDTRDTFACRYYHRLSERSPCEGVLQRLDFRYGLDWSGVPQWSDAAEFCIVADDGSFEKKYPVADAERVGDYRYFVFREAKPGVKYRGEIRDTYFTDRLFGAVELYRLQDPGDDLGNLPPVAPDPDESIEG